MGWISSSIRREIFRQIRDRDGLRCFYCRRARLVLPSPELHGYHIENMATLDHIVPKALLKYDPNRNTTSNLVIACHSCNLERGEITHDIIKAGKRACMTDIEIARVIADASDWPEPHPSAWAHCERNG